jgi:serine phosphatase RsbU (regulator of sigma subunit)
MFGASGDVGGDLVDLVEQDKGWLGYVADVSGHGVSPGVVMGMFKSDADGDLGRVRRDDVQLIVG